MAHNEEPVVVSVCCITYNHAKYIRQCLDGIIAQKTSFKYEIIINDDCSTDGTTEIVKRYADEYPELIRPIFHEENQWSKGTKRILATFVFPKARGKYIALCEGDDYWIDPLKLQKQVDFLNNHQDVSMVFHSAKVVQDDGTIKAPKFGKVENRLYTEKDFVAAWTIPTASMVFRNTVLSYKIKEPEKILNGDIFLVEQCAHTGKVFGISDEMSVYRVHDGGVTYDKRLKFSRMMSLSDHYECLALNFPDIDRHLYNKQWSEAYLFRARHESNYTKRKKYLILAFKTGGISLPFWMLQNLVFRFFSSLGIAKMNKLVLRKHKS